MVGSRNPTGVAVGSFPDGVEVVSHREVVQAAERVVFVAMFPEYYHTLVGLREQLVGKVLVDVSNATRMDLRRESNAEKMAELFPQSRVVKGFNVVSAWDLQTGAHDGSKQVLVCSDCPESKALVLDLTRRLGFSPVDLGGLCASREIEEVPLLLFPSGGALPMATFLLFLFFYLYLFLRNVFVAVPGQRRENSFYKLPLCMVMNQTLPSISLVLLALVYLPGLLAAGVQLWRGTKYQRFPAWLDVWLCRRKELGLLSFLCALLHTVYSLCLALRRAAGSTLGTIEHQQVENLGVGRSVWRSDLFLTCGILGLGVLSLLAVSSLPSVGKMLSWREFTFVQSGLGFTALTLSTMHTLFFGWDLVFHPSAYPYYMPPVHMLALVLPCLVLVGRVMVALPCVSRRLTRIRRGWERKPRPLESHVENPQRFRDV
ncbi:LOW QUALITY PROTEIN: metalloreductase STEAP3 [Gouania willdenowi]|uniref:LOW QUALITY PROTEIN: metalloreductase STEAP3 n=1 Tax=Gouania willdenowi TaxID=441366 RepID=UPI003EB6D020